MQSKKEKLAAAAALAIGILSSGDSQAERAVLDIPAVKGEGTNCQPSGLKTGTKEVLDAICLLSWSWRISAEGPGQVCTAPIALYKRVDAASNDIVVKSVMGEVMPEVAIHVGDPVSLSGNYDENFYRLSLRIFDAKITRYSVSNSDGGDVPVESLSIDYSRVEGSYQAFDVNGDQVGSPETFTVTGDCQITGQQALKIESDSSASEPVPWYGVPSEPEFR